MFSFLFRLTFLILVASRFESHALASSNVSADPSALGPGGSILRVSPAGPFSVDNRLQRNVDFWIKIYTEFYTHHALIHDAKYIDHVYEIVDLKEYPGQETSRLMKKMKKRWKEVLLSVHRKQKNPDEMTGEEKKVFQMFEDVSEPNKFLNAAHRKRLRFQLGLRDGFIRGLFDSGRFLPIMEQIFAKEGLPIELTRLPFVESSFNVRARSKVGASGVWQFMRSTGRLFLKINDAVDERNDPIRATEAAAKLLRQNYESLKNWPLAVTAYNHGRKGMMRAVRSVGSEELEDLVGSYRSRSFGFASSNFFASLLAAIEVEKNAEKYFGQVERDKSLDCLELKLPDYIDIRELARHLSLDEDKLKALNPGILESVFNGERLVPEGYQLRVPYDVNVGKEASIQKFWETYAQIPETYKLKAQVRGKYDRRMKRAKR